MSSSTTSNAPRLHRRQRLLARRRLIATAWPCCSSRRRASIWFVGVILGQEDLQRPLTGQSFMSNCPGPAPAHGRTCKGCPARILARTSNNWEGLIGFVTEAARPSRSIALYPWVRLRVSVNLRHLRPESAGGLCGLGSSALVRCWLGTGQATLAGRDAGAPRALASLAASASVSICAICDRVCWRLLCPCPCQSAPSVTESAGGLCASVSLRPHPASARPNGLVRAGRRQGPHRRSSSYAPTTLAPTVNHAPQHPQLDRWGSCFMLH